MKRFAGATLAVLLLPFAAHAAEDAKALAQDILTKGAKLFDTRDAAAMAATYTDEAEVILYKVDKDSGELKPETTRGRAEIQKGYGELFKDRSPSAKSRNVVESANFIRPDVLVIQGKFNWDLSQEKYVPFIQVRVKHKDAWLLMHLQLFEP